MTADGFGRALRYFVRQAEIYVLYAVAGGFLMAAYVWLINGFDAGISEMLEIVPDSIIYIAMIILLTSGMSSVQYWYSMTISFGCLRKNAFWGSLVMNLLVMAETTVCYFIAVNLFQMDAAYNKMVFYFAVFLFLEGVSGFMGIAAARWGKAVYVVMIIGIIGISMSMGFLAGYAGVSGILISVTDVLGEEIIQNGHWIILMTGAALCIAGNAASWRMLRVLEVKI